MKKRILSILLAVVMLLSVSAVSFAANPGTITVETVKANAGETVEVDISISGNPGVVSFLIDVEYDKSALSLAEVKNGSVLNQPMHDVTNVTAHPYRLSWGDDLATVDNTKNGVIATLVFDVIEGAKSGKAAVNVKYDNRDAAIYNKDLELRDFTIVNGGVEVTAAPAIETPSEQPEVKPEVKPEAKPEETEKEPTVIAPQIPALPFADVKSGDWFYDAVKYAYENNLFGGVSPTEFAPNAKLTRAMLVTVLYRAEGTPEVSETGIFKDVAKGSWYSKAVEWAKANNVVNGVSETSFAPDNSITREQLVTMLYRYAKSPEVSSTEVEFVGKDKTSDYAMNAIVWAINNGIIKGDASGNVDPKGTATRAQVATMLQRFLNLGK